jgi:hypothetical protein
MDRQAFFNKTVELARKQGAKCNSKEGGYAYRNCGRACFIGFHVPQDHNACAYGKGVGDLLYIYPDLKTFWGVEEEDIEFLSYLQDIHDNEEVKHWETAFKEFADKWGLEYV